MSDINYIEIDEEYPKLGINNSSQGFRDNFSLIKNGLATAKGEIEDLQLYTARTDESNNFGGNNIVNANFVSCTDQHYAGGTVNDTTLIQFENGSFQSFTVTQNLQFTLYGLPASGKVGKVTVHLYGNGTPHNVIFVLEGQSILKKNSATPAIITVTSKTDPVIIEFWTYNGGNTVFMNYLGTFI